MPRQKKELSYDEFVQKNFQRPLVNVIKDLYAATEQIQELRKAKTCKEGETVISKAELKRLRKVDAAFSKILELAKNDSSEA